MLKRYLKHSRYSPVADFLRKSSRVMIKNIFKKNFKRKVLITYIIEPFLESKSRNYHSNQSEITAVVEVFNLLGYSIDVVDYRYKLNINYEKYDVIFGFGDVYENSFNCKKFCGKRIYYATGAHPFYQISAEIARVKEFNLRTGLRMLPQRVSNIVWPLSFAFSDALVVIGNKWTENTYTPYYGGEIYGINVTNSFDLEIDFNRKTHREIIWIGSKGSIHKGLDLVLESHKKLNENLKMNIVGTIDKELEDYFLNEFSDVCFHGYMDIHSCGFARIIEKCSYVIFPSCSEGQSSALVLAMGYGCIPITTVQSGVDIEKYGKLINNTTTESIIEAINFLENDYSIDSDLIGKSIEISKNIQENHSIEKFKQKIKFILEDIIV